MLLEKYASCVYWSGLFDGNDANNIQTMRGKREFDVVNCIKVTGKSKDFRHSWIQEFSAIINIQCLSLAISWLCFIVLASLSGMVSPCGGEGGLWQPQVTFLELVSLRNVKARFLPVSVYKI